MGIIDKAKDAMPESLDELKGKAGDVAGTVKDKAQVVAQKLDGKAEEMSKKDGVVGKVAGAAHTVLDKIAGEEKVADHAADTAGHVTDAVQDDASEAVRTTDDATGSAI
jgi:hypothetical protein